MGFISKLFLRFSNTACKKKALAPQLANEECELSEELVSLITAAALLALKDDPDFKLTPDLKYNAPDMAYAQSGRAQIFASRNFTPYHRY
ncbi:MAG: hypothetical protein SPI34_02880 [Opitutales bacterium]|nr:hypothetical protein [Opitutales bacterium]